MLKLINRKEVISVATNKGKETATTTQHKKKLTQRTNDSLTQYIIIFVIYVGIHFMGTGAKRYMLF